PVIPVINKGSRRHRAASGNGASDWIATWALLREPFRWVGRLPGFIPFSKPSPLPNSERFSPGQPGWQGQESGNQAKNHADTHSNPERKNPRQPRTCANRMADDDGQARGQCPEARGKTNKHRTGGCPAQYGDRKSPRVPAQEKPVDQVILHYFLEI